MNGGGGGAGGGGGGGGTGRRPGQQRRGGQRRSQRGRPQRPRPDFDHGFPDVDSDLEGEAGYGISRAELQEKTVDDLQKMAAELKIEDAEKLEATDLVNAILAQNAADEG